MIEEKANMEGGRMRRARLRNIIHAGIKRTMDRCIAYCELTFGFLGAKSDHRKANGCCETETLFDSFYSFFFFYRDYTFALARARSFNNVSRPILISSTADNFLGCVLSDQETKNKCF